MIYLYSGTPGSGKSYHAVVDIVKKLGRRDKNRVIANFPLAGKKITDRFEYWDNSDITISRLTAYAREHHKLGVEGYVESCASGFLVGVETARRLLGQPPIDFPRETAIGALGLYVSNESVGQFQPMNINFGIMPPLDHRVKGKRNKNAQLSQRSLAIIEQLKQEVLSYEDHH